MKGEARFLNRFLDGADKRFIIPVYQRNYDWGLEQCKQLYDDLVKLVRHKRKSHFFGSIVSVHDPYAGSQEFLIIDGQQRLTTVSLMLLALHKLLQEGLLTAEESSLKKKIFETYLVDAYQPEETRIKLKPIKRDQEAFNRLFHAESEYLRNSGVTINYHYFRDRMLRKELTPDELHRAICSLEIIDIMLNHEDNPQLIFESLNSTGLDLTEGDKIRNYVLMGQPSREQEKLFRDYWEPIEQRSGHDVSSFVRDFLSVKRQRTPNANAVYKEFKEYVEGLGDVSMEKVLADLRSYAGYYQSLVSADHALPALRSTVRRLNRLDITVIRPFLLELLRLHEEGQLARDELPVLFEMVESYLFRRNICDLPTNSLNKTFLTLLGEATRLKGEGGLVQRLSYVLSHKRDRSRFPQDEEFVRQLSSRDIYPMQQRVKSYLLERLENGNSAEEKEIYAKLDEGTYSIEHIMPQSLSPQWREALGERWEEIHQEWLHRLANLTLTAYNSRYSNRSFVEKRDMSKGFRDSGFRMNQRISQMSKWGLEELEQRAEALGKRALKLWVYPTSSFEPAEDPLDSCSLDDEVNLTGTTPVKFSFRGEEQAHDTWVSLYTAVLSLLHQEDKRVLYSLLERGPEASELAVQLNERSAAFRAYFELDSQLYLDVGNSTRRKMNLLRSFLPLWGFDPEELTLYYAQAEEENNAVPLRREFWSYALPEIRERTGAFDGVRSLDYNWINTPSAYAGLNYGCIVNLKNARVELYISVGNKEDTKRIFDRLYVHRAEIEAAYGGELRWASAPEKISCKVSVTRRGIELVNREDWPQISAFFADSCARLMRATEPYLERIMD